MLEHARIQSSTFYKRLQRAQLLLHLSMFILAWTVCVNHALAMHCPRMAWSTSAHWPATRANDVLCVRHDVRQMSCADDQASANKVEWCQLSLVCDQEAGVWWLTTCIWQIFLGNQNWHVRAEEQNVFV